MAGYNTLMKHGHSHLAASERRGILWLVLTEKSQHELRRAYPPRYHTDQADHLLYHHATLLFDVLRGDKIVQQYVGRTVAVQVYAHAYNEAVQAVRIRPTTEGDLPATSYGVPHITMSVRGETKPFASVAMLQATETTRTEEPLEQPLILEGTIEFYPFNN